MKIKDLLGSNVTASARIVNQPWPETRTSYSVSVIDHNGLIDYFVASSSGNTVTIESVGDNTSKIKGDMYCVVDNSKEFIRITDISSALEFTTSDSLDVSSGYVYVYSNAGIIDKSLDQFCLGVIGQVLAATSPANTNTMQLVSISGITLNQIVQFGNFIPSFTSVSSINTSTNTITLSNSISAEIAEGETVVFAPAGTPPPQPGELNKEICVLPLDLSPPFVGVDTGLRTANNNIRSSESTFNLKLGNLEFKNTGVSLAGSTENYSHKIQIENQNLSIIANKL